MVGRKGGGARSGSSPKKVMLWWKKIGKRSLCVYVCAHSQICICVSGWESASTKRQSFFNVLYLLNVYYMSNIMQETTRNIQETGNWSLTPENSQPTEETTQGGQYGKHN